MNQIELKYGINPNQKPARIFMNDGSDLPLEVLNGRPGYINFLDALNSWQLAYELKEALGVASATSFKHVSPAGAAIGLPLNETLRKMYHISNNQELSDIACAYARARGADRMSSFGDWIALSDTCDKSCAELIKHEFSDGVIAPDFDDDALFILKSKKKGNYNIVKIDENYRPSSADLRIVFGISFEQANQDLKIDKNFLENIVTENKSLTNEQKRDLIIALITIKYTQSNSVCYSYGGQTIGIGAGQQSRIHCTRLAGDKADLWQLRHLDAVLDLPFLDSVTKPNIDNAIDVYLGSHPEDVLANGKWQELFSSKPKAISEDEKKEYLSKIRGVSLASDAFFPFGDNVERAARSGVSAIVQPGGSIRDEQVIETCNKHSITMAFCKTRLFHH